MDCAHFSVEEGAGVIVVPLLVDVLEVRIRARKIFRNGEGIELSACFCIIFDTSR